MVSSFTPTMVLEVAHSSTKRRFAIREFKALFGVSPRVTALTWSLMLKDPETEKKGIVCNDLLMALHFLKTYSTEDHLSKLFNVTSKTFRKRYKPALFVLANLNIICFEDRHVPGNINHKAKISIDGTDCRIQEQFPFDGKWYSHKFKGPALRYEVGVCMLTGFIVWVMGGFPAGAYPDLKIYRLGLKDILEDGEKVIADGGYKGEEAIWAKGHCKDSTMVESVVRARHENVNSRLKFFNILTTRYRHDLDMHGRCFYAVANLVQLILKNESPLFELEYYE